MGPMGQEARRMRRLMVMMSGAEAVRTARAEQSGDRSKSRDELFGVLGQGVFDRSIFDA
jgi:hypothetical protein